MQAPQGKKKGELQRHLFPLRPDQSQHVDPALPGPGGPGTTEMEVESGESSYSWRSTAKAENGKEKS